MEIINRLRRWGWLAIEAGLLVIIASIVLHILLGPEGGPFLQFVTDNTISFLNALPAGVVVGLALVVIAYLYVKQRLKK